jgi:hypothetical protein
MNREIVEGLITLNVGQENMVFDTAQGQILIQKFVNFLVLCQEMTGAKCIGMPAVPVGPISCSKIGRSLDKSYVPAAHQ